MLPLKRELLRERLKLADNPDDTLGYAFEGSDDVGMAKLGNLTDVYAIGNIGKA